jgi:hypothetical protein
LIACSTNPQPATKSKAAAPKLGIRAHGDETVQPDLSKTPDDLKKVYTYIDDHVDEHVDNLQKWIRQPSISNTGEGIPESAEMVKGFFDQLGCQQTRVFDVGVTEYGSPGNPVVWAKCDEGAPKTLAIYWMYDTMPITQMDAWRTPPFEARLIEQAPFKKVLIGRGAVNSKGPEMSQLNALMSMKAVMGKLPVNLVFIAEGDEERMDIGLRKFVKDHPDLVKADAMLMFGGPLRRRRHHGRLGRLHQLRTHHQRQSLGPRPYRFRHSRHPHARSRQPRVASHKNALEPDGRRRPHSQSRRLQRQH